MTVGEEGGKQVDAEKGLLWTVIQISWALSGDSHEPWFTWKSPTMHLFLNVVFLYSGSTGTGQVIVPHNCSDVEWHITYPQTCD